MKPIYTTVIALALAAQGAFSQTELPEAFTDGLNRAKMVFEMPEGFTSTTIIENPHMHYEYAIKHDTADIEIRYAIRPFDNLIQKYEEAKKDTSGMIRTVMINPDQVSFYAKITTATGYNISKSPIKGRNLADKVIKETYNADNGMVFFVNPKAEFGKGCKYCSMYSIYKKGLGMAFIFFIGDDQFEIVDMAAKVSGSLRFE